MCLFPPPPSSMRSGTRPGGQFWTRWPAVSQHLRVLKDAELVVESVAGTRRFYRVNHAGLMAVRDYLDRLWETTLDNFALLASAEADTDEEEQK